MINDKVTDISGTVTVGTAKHVYRTALKIVMTGWKRKNDEIKTIQKWYIQR